jgi:small subunit ribosomal protein S14
MAKKSVVARQAKRKKVVQKYAETHKALKATIKNKKLSTKEREKAMQALWALPRDAHRIRLRNRCVMTGRPRGVFRRFGICRHKIRELAALGQLTGLLKASW